MKKYTALVAVAAALAAISISLPTIAGPGGGGIGGVIPTPVSAPVATHVSFGVGGTAPIPGGPGANAGAAIPLFLPTAGAVAPIQPKDIINSFQQIPQQTTGGTMVAWNGIKVIQDFNDKPNANDSGDYILVRSEAGSVWERTSATAVKLTEGTILVSVRHPSRYALVDTPDGLVDINADGDVMVSYVGAVLRVENLSDQGTRCKIKVKGTVLDGKSQSVALAPGFEMVASDHKLSRGELRAPDGIARRGFSLSANGHIGVNEFSVESVLAHSAIIASMVTEQGANYQERRVLRDMSKMAAVLNNVYGSGGYQYASKTGIATVPFVTQ